MKQFIGEHKPNPAFSADMAILEEALETLVEISLYYARYLKEGKMGLIPLTATRFLDSMAEVAIAHLLLDQGLIAAGKLSRGNCGEADTRFYRGKIETVHYYLRNFLPQVFGRARIIRLADTSAMDINEEWL
ncbi:MAG: acyl-CoA dehydrogenase C-terminal domain-containing protein [Deltaproteobacteria bacterium]|nr:acyl-CoA dehydrogenase C-terminal domain-containing protein [Deltaproteobacteria bacterium]